jgi:6-phosphogluconate dehydrogenase
VYNRSGDKTDAAVSRATKEGVGDKLRGFKELKDFVASLERPRWVLPLCREALQYVTDVCD